jgi:hypothetical protein
MISRKDIITNEDIKYILRWLLDHHDVEFICHSKGDLTDAGQVDFREIRRKKGSGYEL